MLLTEPEIEEVMAASTQIQAFLVKLQRERDSPPMLLCHALLHAFCAMYGWKMGHERTATYLRNLATEVEDAPTRTTN